jgi:hypothetical protein
MFNITFQELVKPTTFMNPHGPSTIREISQVRRHNCSCGKKAMKKLKRYRKVNWDYPTDGFSKYSLTIGYIYSPLLVAILFDSRLSPSKIANF